MSQSVDLILVKQVFYWCAGVITFKMVLSLAIKFLRVTLADVPTTLQV